MPSIDSALRRSIPAPRTPTPALPPRAPGSRSVDAVLRTLPSHGWTDGWVGRRDRALLVLWQRAGRSFAEIATLTVDDVRIQDGGAVIRGGDGDPVTLHKTEDCLLCGPCALTRWLHALDLSTLHSDGRVVASVIARAVPLTAHSPHVCEGPTFGAQDTGSLRVFPEHDRWAPGAGGPATAPRHPHDLRAPAPGRGRIRYGAGGTAKSDHGYSEPARSPVDHPNSLENRARALLAGTA